jgi:hypothetical protein
VSYLEGWQVIAEANRIFGFDGWQRQTIAVRCVAQAERLIGRDQKPGWGVTYTARVRVTVTAGGLVPLVREGSGAGHGIDVDLGQAHESALKEAETDAMKRALMTFGNPFGLALYDKRQREVTSSAAQERPAVQPRQAEQAAQDQARASAPAEPSAQAAAPPSQQDPGLLPLDAATIRTLHGAIRQLPRPLLEALTQGFRKRFSIPEEATTIADRILQKRHHDWIEAFLVQHELQPGRAARGARPAGRRQPDPRRRLPRAPAQAKRAMRRPRRGPAARLRGGWRRGPGDRARPDRRRGERLRQ